MAFQSIEISKFSSGACLQTSQEASTLDKLSCLLGIKRPPTSKLIDNHESLLKLILEEQNGIM